MKRTEWIKFIYYFGLSIEAEPSMVVKSNVHFVHIGSIPRPSSEHPNISRRYLYKELNLEPLNLRMYELTKNISAEIAPNIYSTLRDLGMIFENIYFN